MSKVIDVEFWNGQLLELLTLEEEVYITQIVEKESNLGIQLPKTKAGVPMLVDVGMSVTVNFYDDVQGMCTFDTKVIPLKGGKYIIKKPAEETVKRVQRRRFFRINVTTDMHLTLPSNDKSVKDKEWHLNTHDISGGGVSFLREDKLLTMDDIVRGKVLLKRETEEYEATFTAKVVNVVKQENGFYKTSLEFQEIMERERSEIISYCMFKQIELRQKLGKR